MASTESTESRAPKYIEGYLDKREKGKLLSLERKRFTGIESGFGSLKAGHGWSNYWTVVRGSVMYFFRDGNTHIKENLLGFLNLGPLTSCEKGKSKKSKNTEWHEFELKTDDGKKYQFRASSEIHREQWVYVIHQAVKQMPPGPLPGEPGFDAAVATPPPPPPAVGAELSDDVINNLVRKQGRGLSFNTHIRKISREQEEYESQTAQQGNKDQSPIYDDFPKEQWFMGKMLRTDAENLLERQPTGTYIVRESETDTRPGSYTISVRHSARVKHHRIETNENGKLVIKGHEHRTFNDLATLVEFFVRTQKDVKMVPYTPKPEYQDESYMPMNEPLKEEEYTVMGQGGEVGDDQYTPMVCGLRTGGDGCESQKRNNEEDTRYLPQQVAQMKLTEKVGSKFEDHTYVNIEYLKQVSGYKPQNSGYKPQESKVDMYENLPSKNEEPNPPPIPRREPTDSSNKPSHAYCNYPSPQERQEGPPLPPRRGKSLMQLHGYENMPSKPGASVRRWDSAKLAEPPPRRRPPCQRSVTLQHSDFQAMSTRAPSLMPRAKYY